MSWYDEMVAAGRSKSLTTGNTRCGVAAVHEVLGSPALETQKIFENATAPFTWDGARLTIQKHASPPCVMPNLVILDQMVGMYLRTEPP